jgi:hypothetical protein
LLQALDFDPKLSCPSGYEPDGELTTRDISTGLVEAHQSCIRSDFQLYNPSAEKALNDQLTDQEAQAVGYPNADIIKRLGPRFESGYRELVDRACTSGYTEGAYLAEIPSYWNARGGDFILSRFPGGVIDQVLSVIGQTYSHAGLALGRFGVRHNTMFIEELGKHLLNEGDPDKILFDPWWLDNGYPGIITQNTQEALDKREFQPLNALVLKPLDETTGRPWLTAAMNWAQQYNHYKLTKKISYLPE